MTGNEGATQARTVDSQNRWTEAFGRKSALGFMLLVAVLLPIVLYRASLLSSFWFDEVYTIQMTHRSFPDIIEITSVDAHPPGYYFMLKCWLKAARTIGLPENIFVARAFNVPWWLLLAAAAWFGGRWVLGAGGGTLLGCIVAANPMICDATKDLRGYAVAVPCLFSCFMIMQIAASLPADSPRSRRLSQYLWTLYCLLASCALWMHLFSSMVLGLLGIAWLMMCGRRGCRSTFTVHGFIAQATAALSFAGWLPVVRRQALYVQTVALDWMTPPTVSNYLSVFTFWFPLGKSGEPDYQGALVATVAGAASLAVPLVWIAARIGRPLHEAGQSHLRRMAACGILIPLSYVLTLWLVDRFEIVSIFHGPRYPVLSCGMWLSGLVALVYHFAPAARRTMAAFLLFLPLFAATCIGLFRNIASERKATFRSEWEELRRNEVWHDKPIYVMSPELIPYIAPYLEGLDVRRIEEIVNIPEIEQQIQVLMPSFWPNVSFLRDKSVELMMRHGDLSEMWRLTGVPKKFHSWSYWQLQGVKHEMLRSIQKYDWSPPPPEGISPGTPLARAVHQKGSDGFGDAEYSGPMDYFRWGLGEESRIRFTETLAPGRWELHINQFRHPYPTESITASARLEQDRNAGNPQAVVPPGDSVLVFAFELKKELREPCFVLTQPAWRPNGHIPGALDSRPLTFLFRHAWLERVEEQPAGS